MVSSPASTPPAPDSRWQQHRVLSKSPPCWRHSDVLEAVRSLQQRHEERLHVAKVGDSFEGRSIQLLTLGSGARKILLWTQMHGDEPSATPAVLDLIDYLLSTSNPEGSKPGVDTAAAEILDAFTLLVVPMLNPDGTERATRRSAQGIDINRDALQRSTPEARLLKRLRDEHEPLIGFNLHDQDRRKLVGDTPVLATQSVLAVAGDAAQTVTEGRRRAMRVAAAMAAEFRPHIPGGVGRYDATFSERAFGDNLTGWGTPIVLLESGGVPPGRRFSHLSELTFVGLVKALTELAKNDAADYSEADYRAIPPNRNDGLVDVVLDGGFVLVAGKDALRVSRSDLAFNIAYSERDLACASPDESQTLEDLRQRGVGHRGSAIQELGDVRHLFATSRHDYDQRLFLPLLEVAVQGLDASAWLTPAVLARWAHLGVGRVTWQVAPEAWQAAQGAVDSLFKESGPVITVSHHLPAGVVVAAQPQTQEVRAETPTLKQALAEVAGRNLTPEEVHAALASAAQLRRFRQASFIVLRRPRVASEASASGPSDWVSGNPVALDEVDDLEIETVWLEGQQLDRD